jgi:hypothetical protein
MVTSVNSVNTVSNVPAAVNTAPSYDAAQTDFLKDLQKFMALLAAAEANPNDKTIAIELEQAGKALSADKATLAAGTDADKAMASQFEALTGGDLDTLIADCVGGNLTSVMNDVYGITQNPGLQSEIQEGLAAFVTQYPFPG